MKALAYTIFVISVLLVSGFARADLRTPFMQQPVFGTPVKIKEVNVDKYNLLLQLRGTLPTPCTPEPTATLIADENEPTTLILRLSSPFHNGTCVQRLNYYSTVVDLPALASEIQIDDKAVYVIKTEGYDFEMHVVGSDLKR